MNTRYDKPHGTRVSNIRIARIEKKIRQARFSVNNGIIAWSLSTNCFCLPKSLEILEIPEDD